MRSCLVLLGLPVLLAMPALLARPALGTAVARPVVVELFTSEGCSSCPPADRFLNELVRNRPDLLPLAFHVTYWDSLGWHDPFSIKAATDRQIMYSGHFGGNSVFTPQMVVDGVRSLVGSSRDEAETAMRAALAHGDTAAAIEARREGDRIAIRIGQGQGEGRILLVGFDREHQTRVGRGENSGQTLTESNVVRAIRAVGDWNGRALTLAEVAPAGGDAAVLLQAPDGRILGAARLDALP